MVPAGLLVPQRCSLTVFVSPQKVKSIPCTLQKISPHAARESLMAVTVDFLLAPWTILHHMVSQLVDSMATPLHVNHIHLNHVNMTSQATVRRVLVMDLRQRVLPRVSQVGCLQGISKSGLPCC